MYGLDQLAHKASICDCISSYCFQIVLHDANHAVQFLLKVTLILAQNRQIAPQEVMQLVKLRVPYLDGFFQRAKSMDNLAHLPVKRARIRRHSFAR